MTHDFDARANYLALEIRDEWDENTKRLHHENKARARQGIVYQYGQAAAETKLQNFMDLGSKPFSVLAFHNRFAEQVRHSFVVGSYYPALVGACALGERLLNHLILNLRENFKGTPEYKKVHRKSSFDDWELAIGTLESWGLASRSVLCFSRACEYQEPTHNPLQPGD